MNAFPDNLGFHEDMKVDEILADIHLTKVMQFFVSNGRGWNQPNRNHLISITTLMEKVELRPVIHCPYLVTTCRVQTQQHLDMQDYTRKYIYNLYSQLAEMTDKKIPYVLHTGKPNKGEEYEYIKNSMQRFLDELSTGLDRMKLNNVEICLETDANGYCANTRFYGIAEVVKANNDSRIGICVDSEHSFASGFDVSKEIPEDYWPLIRVLHLNPIPPEVRFGSGLDRHSTTMLRECSQGFSYYHFVEGAIKRDIPIILERGPIEMIKDDIEFVSEKFKHLK